MVGTLAPGYTDYSEKGSYGCFLAIAMSIWCDPQSGDSGIYVLKGEKLEWEDWRPFYGSVQWMGCFGFWVFTQAWLSSSRILEMGRPSPAVPVILLVILCELQLVVHSRRAKAE